MGGATVFVVSADAAVSDSVKSLVDATGMSAETFCSLQVFLDTVGQDRRGCLVIDAHFSDLRDPVAGKPRRCLLQDARPSDRRPWRCADGRARRQGRRHGRRAETLPE